MRSTQVSSRVVILAMTKRVVRVLTIALSAAITASSLSGCSYLSEGQSQYIAIGHGADGVEIAVCKGFDATTLTMSERNTTTGEDWVHVWEVNGNLSIAKGDVFTVGQQVENANQTLDGQVHWESGWQFSVGVLSAGSQHGFSSVFSPLKQPLPKDGNWMQPSGEITDIACPATS